MTNTNITLSYDFQTSSNYVDFNHGHLDPLTGCIAICSWYKHTSHEFVDRIANHKACGSVAVFIKHFNGTEDSKYILPRFGVSGVLWLIQNPSQTKDNFDCSRGKKRFRNGQSDIDLIHNGISYVLAIKISVSTMDNLKLFRVWLKVHDSIEFCKLPKGKWYSRSLHSEVVNFVSEFKIGINNLTCDIAGKKSRLYSNLSHRKFLSGEIFNFTQCKDDGTRQIHGCHLARNLVETTVDLTKCEVKNIVINNLRIKELDQVLPDYVESLIVANFFVIVSKLQTIFLSISCYFLVCSIHAISTGTQLQR